MNNYSALIDKYTDKLSSDPKSRVFAPLGEVYRSLGMYDKALETYEEGLKHNPTYTLGIVGYAQSLIDIEQFQRAYSILKPYYHNNTDNIRYLTVFANVCDKLNFIDECLKANKSILFFNPKNKEAASFIAKYEDSEVSIQSLNSTLKQFDVDELDDDMEEWSQLNLVEKEAVEETESPVSHTIDIAHDDTAPIFSHTLVDLYLKQGAKDKAIELLEKALEVNSKDQKVIERLAQLKQSTEVAVEDSRNLMDIFDKKVGHIYKKDDSYVENMKMAYDLFMVHINKRRDEVLGL